MEEERIDPQLKELVLYRLMSSRLPENIEMAIGDISGEPMNMEEIIEHVKNDDATGKIIIEMELNYLKALKAGIISQI
jgi:hypothetical protein